MYFALRRCCKAKKVSFCASLATQSFAATHYPCWKLWAHAASFIRTQIAQKLVCVSINMRQACKDFLFGPHGGGLGVRLPFFSIPARVSRCSFFIRGGVPRFARSPHVRDEKKVHLFAERSHCYSLGTPLTAGYAAKKHKKPWLASS